MVILATGFFVGRKVGKMDDYRCFCCNGVLLEGETIEIVTDNVGFKEVDGFKSLIKCYLHFICTNCFKARTPAEIDSDIRNIIFSFRRNFFKRELILQGAFPVKTIALFISKKKYTKGMQELNAKQP